MMMKCTIPNDAMVEAPAASVWQIYRGCELAHFINKHLSDVIGTFDIVQGDGGVGSVIRLAFVPGIPGFEYHKERIKVMDDEKRLKETEVVEGGFLALGFTSSCLCFEIIENGTKSSIIRSTMKCEIDEKLAENVSMVSLLKFPWPSCLNKMKWKQGALLGFIGAKNNTSFTS